MPGPHAGYEQAKTMWLSAWPWLYLVTATKSPTGYSLGLTNSSALADGIEIKGWPVGRAHGDPLARAAVIMFAHHSSALPL